MKKFIVLFLVSIFVLSSCNNNKKNTEPEVIEVDTKEQTNVYTSAKMEAQFKDPNVADVYAKYIDLKTALVNTNAEAASTAANNLKTAFANVGVDEATMTAAQAIEDSKDIEAQRKEFFKLSEAVSNLLENSLTSGTIYKQYCPMAFGNTGAYWLSNSRDIYNPYFGDKMLKCGRIDVEIQ